MNAPTDEQLLLEFLSGKPGSFELLVRRHAQELYQFAFRFTGSSVAAEDVVQDTLLQLHASAKSFDQQRRLKPWLFTIAANKARDFIRRRDRKREVALEAEVGGDNEAGQRFVELFAADSDAPDEDIIRDERRRIVKSVVDAMPLRLSETLILAYYHRFSYRDIGVILGIPLGTVKSRLHAALVCFRRTYEEAVRTHVKESG